MKTIIHVNRQVLARNRKTGENKPPISAKTYKQTVYGHRVRIAGPSELIYQPGKPLKCGAVLWIEVDSMFVFIDGKPAFQ